MSKFLLTTALIVWFAAASNAQPGSLDATFGTNGVTTLLPQPVLNKAYSIVEQSDHSLLVAGYSISNGANVFVLSRLFPDGNLDTGFGLNGFVQIQIGTDALCYAMTLQSDGKILLAGGASTAANVSKDFAVLRLLSTGVPDSSFAGDGIQTVSFGSGDEIARAVLVQPDGNILVSGTATTGNNSLFAIARLKTDGVLDPAFSGDGKNVLGIGTIFSNGYGMALLPDGKILMTGAAKFGMADDVALARFLPNGLIDNTFGTSGAVVTNLGSDADSGNSIAIQPDGKILVAGITGADRDFALLRYLPDGSLDPDFGSQGVVITDFFGSDDYANGVILQPNGNILVSGYAYFDGKPDFAMARYLPSGALDPDFGLNGKVTTDISNGYDFGFPVILETDGKILQAGYSYFDLHTAFAALRYISGLNVGILDLNNSFSGFIAPNPIRESAIFEFETLAAESFSLTLLNLQGQLVQTFFTHKTLQSGKQSEFLQFAETLPKGWYLLHLKGSAHQWTVKILKD